MLHPHSDVAIEIDVKSDHLADGVSAHAKQNHLKASALTDVLIICV